MHNKLPAFLLWIVFEFALTKKFVYRRFFFADELWVKAKLEFFADHFSQCILVHNFGVHL